MRKIALIILIYTSGTSAYCQTIAEWTQQKKTQIQYLLDQITANKVFIDYVEKGYEISKIGLTTIQDIKSGDFNLHRDLFHSLEIVNPAIRRYSRIADIIACQLRIVKNINTTIRDLTARGQFNPDELDHTKRVFENLLDECMKNVNELLLVISSGELRADGYRMTDDERIKRIDQIYSKMQGNYTFCKSFSEECLVLAAQRLNEVFEIKIGKQLNGIK